MSETNQSWVQRSVRIIPWVLLGISLFYFLFLGGWRDATVGRFHRKATELFSDTTGVTRVEISLLKGDPSLQPVESFPLRPFGEKRQSYGSVVLEGEVADAFMSIWRSQEVSLWRQTMCHEPLYGFRLFRGNKLVGETSISWECHNFFVTPYPGLSGWYGFLADSNEGKALLDFCNAQMFYRGETVEAILPETEPPGPYDRPPGPGQHTAE